MQFHFASLLFVYSISCCILGELAKLHRLAVLQAALVDDTFDILDHDRNGLLKATA